MHAFICHLCMCRQWQEERGANPDIPVFEKWIRDAVHRHPLDPNNADDMDLVLLCSRPSQLATRYTRIKAYGNHFRVEDPQSAVLQTYDSGVASVFHMSSTETEPTTLNYVGVLKDILKLDYGPLRTPIIVFRCEWMKQRDNWGNPTYVRDEADSWSSISATKFRRCRIRLFFLAKQHKCFGQRKWEDRDGELCWQRRHGQKDTSNAHKMYSLREAHK